MLTADAVLHGCTVDLLGLAMQLEAVEPRCANALASVLGGARTIEAVPRVRLSATVAAPSVPSSPPDLSTSEFDTWRPGLGEMVLRHRSGLTARATNTTIEVGGDAAHFDANFRRVCLSALAHLLAQHDRFVVHGAAIATGGRAVLVLGGTGAGKSTLALCALLANWEVLADDLVVLRSSDSGPIMGGVPRPLAVPSDVLDGNTFDAQPIAGDQRGRRELPPDVIALGSYSVAGSIVVKHADEARGAVEPIAGHALLHDLLRSWAPIESPDDLERILPIAAAVARSPAASLYLGREPATRVADTIGLLEGVRAQFGLM